MPSIRFGRLSVICLFLALAAIAFAADVQETVLPNGLTVLIKEVHAAPVVTVDAWYKVGSRNEQNGLTGGSHLLEHMTYRGTTEFPDRQMKTEVSRNGADFNGATFYDYTHYHITIASDRIMLPLRIEAARMHSALIRQQDLDSEMTVVRSELEGDENDPGRVLFDDLMSTAFKVAPYHWPVVGWRADVEHMSADQLRHYYHTYYLPNNATLVIVGDIDAKRTLEQVKQLFGVLPRGPQPNQWVTPEPEQRGERKIFVRKAGQVPMEDIAWHIPSINNKDIPALMMLEQILGSGRLSRMYQQVVETKEGVSAWAESLMLRDAGLFMVGGAAAPGQPLEPIEKTLLAEVEKIKTTPPTAEEMARSLRQIDASLIYDRESVTAQAAQLGEYQTEAGDWRFPDRLPARLHAVTPEDVSRVAKTYLTAEGRTIGIFQPTGGKGGAPGGSAPTAKPAGYLTAQAPSRIPHAQGPAARTTPQSATGTARPQPAPVHRERFVLPNGIVLIVQENHANATVSIRANMKAGHAYDPDGKKGLADMVANLLDRGTTTRTSTQIAHEMEGAAAGLSTGTGSETVGITGKALSEDTELLIRNMADVTRNPTFPQEELDKMRTQGLASLALERDDPEDSALRNFYRAALPEGHPYRMASFDEEETGIQAITRDDLLAFHRARYTPQTMMIAVVGDVKVDDVRRLIEKYFGDWQGADPTTLTFAPTPLQTGKQVVTKIEDKSEVDIFAGYAGGLTRRSPDYYSAEVMNFILGGGGPLNSRLGEVIRDQHGLAYTVFSEYHASTGAGPWFTYLGVNPANTDKAVALLKTEIARMRDKGVSEQEVKDSVAYITGAHAIELETNSAMASELLNAEYFHLGLDYPEKFTGFYRAVTRDQVNDIARKYLHPDQLVVSIAGPYGD